MAFGSRRAALLATLLLVAMAVGPAVATAEPSVRFDDQVATDSVVIETATLPEGGFVAVYTVTDDEPAVRLGHSDYLAPGDHEAVSVDLEQRLTRSRPLVAVVHRDTDGDRAFGFDSDGNGTDAPYTFEGDRVSDTATITVTTPTAGLVTVVYPSPTAPVDTQTRVVVYTRVVMQTRIVTSTAAPGQPGFGLMTALAAALVLAILARKANG